MKKLKTKLTCLSLVMAIIIGTMTAPAINPIKTEAAKKAYCESLELNYNLELDKEQTFKETGIYQEDTFFKKKKEIDVKYTISSKRQSVGKNYKVTYKVNYEYLGNPKIENNKKTVDDWWWSFTQPLEAFKVFDYKTGKTLMSNNKLGVKVSSSKWKSTYYPKQFYNYTGSLAKEYKNKKMSISLLKNSSVTFSVTYPKKCKDVVVGIGFVNRNDVPKEFYNWGSGEENRYNSGKVPYGKTSYYKEGKKTMSYMRLNK